jgi:hypothetical protein
MKNPAVGNWVPKMIHNGVCDHYYKFSNKEPSGLHAYSCTNCPNGILIDPKETKIVKGKICQRLKKS